ncbi:hypothetical protein GCM10011391_05220 [Pullulanibacillus camelliae]|uniref:S1 motif domain-containing protein n=1 Tax=Pullulanibacillus camelliae TaxID=1707096 RepID=A0A8J2YFM5_9BACL|nr:S1-like domain-containing RNA-binding protein [Pullulanibacillus camelliae]GGE29646.1 hypothetical protein GCM10011391_05220 [Pullulanibacillus camelliae]
MCALQAGDIVTLQVEREAPFGYFLSDGNEDVLLHKNEMDNEMEIELEQAIEVFLFTDHQGRIAATQTLPKITKDIYDWVEVVDVNHRFGVFVSIGTSKDVLVSKDDLPESFAEWPTEGDGLYCTLITDKKGRLFGKRASADRIESLSVPAGQDAFNQNVSGTVYHLLSVGVAILTDNKWLAFNHESERTEPLRLGQRIEGRVIDVKEDGTVNVSLKQRGYESMDKDAEIIYTYLNHRGGAMPYWDKTQPDIIQKQFQLSKAAFKRALGRLMKQDMVYQEEGWTYLKNKERKGNKKED